MFIGLGQNKSENGCEKDSHLSCLTDLVISDTPLQIFVQFPLEYLKPEASETHSSQGNHPLPLQMRAVCMQYRTGVITSNNQKRQLLQQKIQINPPIHNSECYWKHRVKFI